MSGKRDAAAAWGTIGTIAGGLIGALLASRWDLPDHSNLLIPALGGLAGIAHGLINGFSGRPEALVEPQEALERWRQSIAKRARADAQRVLEQIQDHHHRFDPILFQGKFSGGSLSFTTQHTRLSERAWPLSPKRTVLLADPAYGKTTSLTILLETFNRQAETRAGAPVAVLCPLWRWAAWNAETEQVAMADWLPQLLMERYGPEGLDQRTAVELVERHWIVPFFDGLDEVDAPRRAECVRQIQAFSDATAIPQAYLLTSRLREFQADANEDLSVDEYFGLKGLDNQEIKLAAQEAAERKPRWRAVVDAIDADPDCHYTKLFRSPFRMAIATSNFDDPSVLTGLTKEEAVERIWSESVAHGSFRGASPEDNRRWLHFIATNLKRLHRQSFGLHELYLFDEKRPATFNQFRVGVTAIALVWLLVNLGTIWRLDLVVGLLLNVLFSSAITLFLGLSIKEYPAVKDSTPRGQRLKAGFEALFSSPAHQIVLLGVFLCGLVSPLGWNLGLATLEPSLARGSIAVGMAMFGLLVSGVAVGEPMVVAPPTSDEDRPVDRQPNLIRRSLFSGLAIGAV
ncbi:MAG: hypothetical protein AAFZ65_07905, partial [Planctomycetota bacterium]